jgi:predicted enzyme related to lactoylglutathione lyase
MSTPIVFLDFAGPDAASLRSFYSDVFGWEAATAQIAVSVTAPLPTTIREDPER